MKTFYSIIAITALGLIAACGSSSSGNDPHHIKVGITSGPEREIAEAAKKEAKEKYNLEVELVAFNDYVVPNEALNQGDIDVNAFQHVPYLEAQSKQRGYKLAAVGNTFVYPIVAYSKKIKSAAELQDGSTIAIPNDPTNGGRALLLLQKNGLLKLKEGVGLLPKVIDIAENPKRLKIVEIEAPQLPRVLDDREVTVAIINNNFAAQAGLDAATLGILKEEKESPYVNVIAARLDNKDEEKVKNFVKAYQSDAVLKAAEKVFREARSGVGNLYKRTLMYPELTVSIRQMTIDDLLLVNEVCCETYTRNFHDHWEPGGLDLYLEDVFGLDLLQEELQEDSAQYYTAYVGDRPVAFMKLVRSPQVNGEKMEEDVELDKLYVLPECKGMQIGKKLMELALNMAREENRKRYWLVVLESNTPAIAFYEKLGFRFHSRLSILYPFFKEEHRPALRMLKDL